MRMIVGLAPFALMAAQALAAPSTTVFGCPAMISPDIETLSFTVGVIDQGTEGLVAELKDASEQHQFTNGQRETFSAGEFLSDPTGKDYAAFIAEVSHSDLSQVTSVEVLGWGLENASKGDGAEFLAIILRDKSNQVLGIGGSMGMMPWFCKPAAVMRWLPFR